MTMLRFMDEGQFRRWIAGAGLLCLGTGSLLTGGCAGRARDSVADAKPGRARLETRSVASREKPGRASLSDTDEAARPDHRELRLASRNRSKFRPGDGTADDPFLNEQANARPAVAQRQPVKSRPSQPTAVAQDRATRPAPAQPTNAVAANRPVRTPSANTTAPKPKPSTTSAAERATVAQRRPQTAPSVTQASASKARPPKRPIAPVIRPATPETPIVKTPATTPAVTSFERQRADRLMERAHVMLQNNFREEALRLAMVAQQLETSKQAAYLPGEERPSQLVAKLQGTSPITSAEPAAATSANVLASTDDREAKSLLKERQTQKSTRRGTVSTPATPVRMPRIEATEISAGWQSSSGTLDASGKETRSNVQTPHFESVSAGASSSANGGKVEVASPAPTVPAESRIVTADVQGPSLTPGTETASVEPAAVAINTDPGDVPAPQALPSPGENATELEEIAEAEPLAEIEEPTEHSSINVTSASVLGLIAGIAGLCGLTYWRRQEQKKYTRRQS